MVEETKRLRPRELSVYKKAFAAAIVIHEASEIWPKHELYGGLADQIRRASRGICANLAEGLAKRGDAEQKRFINMALGSVEEVQVWGEFAVALRYQDAEWGKRLDDAYPEIGKMLWGLIEKRMDAV